VGLWKSKKIATELVPRATEKTRGAAMKNNAKFVDGRRWSVCPRAECSAVGGVCRKKKRQRSRRLRRAAKTQARAGDGAAEIFIWVSGTTRRRIRNSAFYPNGGKNTGVYTSKLGPGGNSLINFVSFSRTCGRLRGINGDDLGYQGKIVQSVCVRE